MTRIDKHPVLVLAPMQGLTEVLFRRVYERCFPKAFDYAISPFISLTHGNLNDAWKKVCDVLPDANNGSMPVVPQVLGREVDEFVALANRLHDIGYAEINWNIGCPMRRVAGKRRGSGILPYPNEVRAVLDGVIPRMSGSLSIKMRLGHCYDDEIINLLPILNDYPLKNITIHPRTGKQLYGGTVNLKRFAQVLPMLRHPIIYNGDIRILDDYHRITTRFRGLEGVMIGRGVLYAPTLPPQIKKLTVGQGSALAFIAELTNEITRQTLSDEAKIRKMKEYWCLLWHATPLTETEAKRILRLSDLTLLHQAIISAAK